MKIILVYTPRSGSTSILKYFNKLKPDYECFNEPWFSWMVSNVYDGNVLDYNEVLNKDKVFIKTSPVNCPVSFETLIKDFDKVIFLLRKNKKEQTESGILVHNESTFLDRTKRKYDTYKITQHEMDVISKRYENHNTLIEATAIKYDLPLYYYEDLYYGSFDKLFKELDLHYNEQHYNEFLNVSNRYRIGTTEVKINNTII
jgi:hypothetical protein